MNKAITRIKPIGAVALCATLLSGCGLTQQVSDGTAAIARSVFYKQVRVLHLDIAAREGVNNDSSGKPLATLVRIYQLQDRRGFDGSDYASLLANDSDALRAGRLAQKDIRVRPGEAITVDMPLEAGAQFVALAAMFLSPDEANNDWRLVLRRNDLDPDTARLIEINQQTLTLLPHKEQR